jgi:hypothetical protein
LCHDSGLFGLWQVDDPEILRDSGFFDGYSVCRHVVFERSWSAPHAPRAAAEGPDDFKANWVRGQAIRDAGGMTGIK